MIIRDENLTFAWTFEAARKRFIHTVEYESTGREILRHYDLKQVNVPDMAFCTVRDGDRSVMFMAGAYNKENNQVVPIWGTHVTYPDCFVCLGKKGRDAVVAGMDPVTVFWSTTFTKKIDFSTFLKGGTMYKTVSELSRAENFIVTRKRLTYQIQPFVSISNSLSEAIRNTMDGL